MNLRSTPSGMSLGSEFYHFRGEFLLYGLGELRDEV